MTGYRKLYWIQETLRDVYQFRQDADHYWKAANAQILSPVIGRRQDDDKINLTEIKVCLTTTISGRTLHQTSYLG